MLSIEKTTYPDRTLPIELWYRYLAMGGKSFKKWVQDFNNFCYSHNGVLKMDMWRLKPHYADGSDKIVDVELWKGAKDYALSFEEKAILVKILKKHL